MSTRARRTENARLRLPHPDTVLSEIDNALRTLFAPAHAARPVPGELLAASLDEHEQRVSTRLMRVNHTGEVCAQALYRGQLAVARNERVKVLLERAAQEETEHLAWTEQRIEELGGRKSVLNPLWYLNSFAMGVASGLAGDRWSLGFLAETEHQVERHLEGHLERLPAEDLRSRAIVEQMKADEAGHATSARRQGAKNLPRPVRSAMKLLARVMTSTSHWI
jgi:ubiquinone biosynthesis monooxygenase Coq7